jgi:hypothetical protein
MGAGHRAGKPQRPALPNVPERSFHGINSAGINHQAIVLENSEKEQVSRTK